jgi:hypothetical protein
MKFRIKQIDDNNYIPQVKMGWFRGWVGIDNKWNENWFSKEFQTKHCAKPTLLEAQQEVEIYKTRIHKKNGYPKYYKL